MQPVLWTSGFFLCILAIGYTVCALLLPLADTARRGYIAAGLGLIINFTLLFLLPLHLSCLMIFLLGSAALVYLLIKRKTRSRDRLKMLSFRSAMVVVFFLLILLSTLAYPIQAWDARSIWFAHSKIIFFENSIWNGEVWSSPSMIFSHADYPKLVSALSAQIAFGLGFWNEYFPLISIVVMVTLLFSGFAYFMTFRISSAILIVPFLMSGDYLVNGYMDGLLALSAALCLLNIDSAADSRRPESYYSAAIGLALNPMLKNEGMLISAILAIYMIVRTKDHIWSFLLSAPRRHVTFTVILILPIVLWSVEKALLGLQNDLGLFSDAFLARVFLRWDEAALIPLVGEFFKVEMFTSAIGSLVVLLSINAGLRAFKKEPQSSRGFAVFALAGVFCGVMAVIYLGTPWDLAWHLNTSLDRVLLTPVSWFWIHIYYQFDEIEQRLNKWAVSASDIGKANAGS